MMSRLVGQDHEWVVYNEYKQTSAKYLLVVTAIDKEWVADIPYVKEKMMQRKVSRPRSLHPEPSTSNLS
jgi:hypothetical protein